MKKILFAALALTALFFTSCENDDIVIDSNENRVDVTVSLTGLFSSYNFKDTKHDIDVADEFRTFNSEGGGYIQARVLFYNSKGLLVDSILNYSTNTNAVSKSLHLAAGQYTAIATLSFAYLDDDDKYVSFWDLVDKENLSTAYLDNGEWSGSRWHLLSYDSQEITVGEGNTAVNLNPQPVGSLVYYYFQNFQYPHSANVNVGDNGIRQIAVYTQNFAYGYRLNPNASEKFLYTTDAGESTWRVLGYTRPSNWYWTNETPRRNWTFFESDVYGYFYILAPRCSIYFGYTKEGENTFNGHGMKTYDITSGTTYLAYWDWFHQGNPYFGVATNNKWYSAPATDMLPYQENFFDNSMSNISGMKLFNNK